MVGLGVWPGFGNGSDEFQTVKYSSDGLGYEVISKQICDKYRKLKTNYNTKF